ncbi:hypothetical protein E2C01_082173 [Portunus trituberculatus]|uniref:Uncharacterized protein n=1 Tax=Portunus trituberculatus TaxID=210409 RepID=A0A5B7IXS0_PORTR|nr:hypothetical protein [Portunus trituberculatus]
MWRKMLQNTIIRPTSKERHGLTTIISTLNFNLPQAFP